MASTSVHLPDDLVAALDRLAAERGVSRNRLIVESCRRLVAGRVEWPEGYLAAAGTPIGDLDVAIGAIAVVAGARVATLSTRHFERLDGLAAESWG